MENAFSVIPDNLCLEAGRTYIIDRVIRLTDNLSIPPGVTLIFKGGRFESDSEVVISAPHHDSKSELTPLTGVAIEAPLTVIFGKNVSVDGLWIARHSSPVWFEPTERDHHIGKERRLDYAESIAKAITMQRCGDVYLPKGDYYISKPIVIPQGITLRGDLGQLYGKSSTSIFPLGTESPDSNRTGGTLQFPHEYMVYVNCNLNKEPLEKYANPWIALKNITLINYYPTHKSARCVFACFAAGFENVIWYDFIQALVYSTHYADSKKVFNCIATSDYIFPKEIEEQFIEPGDGYMFNLNGLGDALMFQHNHVGAFFGRGLYLNLCGGGTIDDNIINCDVRIDGSKGISYTNNHMETGAQLTICDSIVSLTSNYFEKGERPSIVVKGIEKSRGIAAITDCLFNYYNRDRIDNEPYSDKFERISKISEYDIEVNEMTSLTLTNVFRSDHVIGFDTLTPYGVYIRKEDGTAFTDFNNHSFFCSKQCSILPGYNVQSSYEVESPNAPEFYHLQKSGFVNWFRKPGTYRYKYQIVWDKARGIFKTDNNNSIFPLPSADATLTFTDHSHGTLMNIAALPVGNTLMVRMYREFISDLKGNEINTWEMVDLPLSGAHMIYDNGESVCGFKWKESTGPVESRDIDFYSHLSLKPQNVNAWSNGIPSSLANWKTGDLIYNSGSDTSWSIKIVK